MTYALNVSSGVLNWTHTPLPQVISPHLELSPLNHKQQGLYQYTLDESLLTHFTHSGIVLEHSLLHASLENFSEEASGWFSTKRDKVQNLATL